MTGSATPPTAPLRWGGPTLPILAVAALVLAYDSRLPTLPAFALAALGVAAGAGLRVSKAAPVRDVAIAPVLVVLGVLAVATPVAPVSELLVGAAGIAFVAWLADDPARPPAGARRGAVVWAVPGLAVGVAWASEFLLPSTSAPLGVAGGLLAASLIALAYLVSRPELFDREAAPTI